MLRHVALIALVPLVPLVALVSACDPKTEPAKPEPAAAVKGKLEMITASPGAADIAPIVTTERAKAEARGRILVVIVGAPWCEPCVRFHKAAANGELDAAFPNVILLEFDRDRDEAALERAGYGSKLIPLLALPRADGVSSGKHMEGSVKGEGAVAEMSPRLRRLLGQ